MKTQPIRPLIRFNADGLVQVGPCLYEPEGYADRSQMFEDIYWERYEVYFLHGDILMSEAGRLASRDVVNVSRLLKLMTLGLSARRDGEVQR
tara:strand:+ start:138 stop:413 length:276 start_codon:yes stop_codon:yes gene_type:complete